jgi:WD40 repeat protein
VNDVVLKLNVVETPTEWILMCESPAGGSTQHIPVPFTAEELQSRLHEVEMSVIRSYSKVMTRRGTSPEATALKFGTELADVLLSGETRVFFEECRRLAKASKGQVRVLLETDGDTVSQIPWEFTVDPKIKDDYLALRLSLARHLRVSTPVPPLTVQPPLRVLGVHAQPHDRPTLDYSQEQESVAAIQSVSSDLVQVTWLEGDRWSDLSRKLDEGGWHVLHFIGHGGFDEDTQSGFLELSDDTGAALPVPARRIGAAAAASGDLRLVVLNACDSAATGAAGVFSSTAAKLMMEGIPAVVAMQYEITDPAALAFAAAFYEALARGKPVDQAVTKAREIVRATQNSLEFATPALFLASQQTQLFQVERPTTKPATTTISTSTATAPAHPGQPVAPPQQQVHRPFTAGPVPTAQGALAETESTWKTGIIGRINNWLGVQTQGSGAQAQPGTQPGPQPGPQPAQRPAHGPAPRPSASSPTRATAPPPVPAPELDPDTPRIARLGATQPLTPTHRAALGPRDLLAMACPDGSVRAWNVRKARWASHCTLPTGVHPRSLAWSPWPRHVASAQDDGSVVVWDLEKEVPLRLIHPACDGIASLAFSHSGSWLAVVGRDRSVQVFDAQGRARRRFSIPASTAPAAWHLETKRIGPCAFAPGDRHLVVAANDGAVVQLDVKGTVATSWPHAQAVCGLALSEDRVVTCSVDGRLRLWQWNGRHLRRHELPARVEHLAFSPAGEFLATASADRRLTIWSAEGTELGTAALDGRPVGLGVGGGVGDRYVVSASETGVVETWATDVTAAKEGRPRD